MEREKELIAAIKKALDGAWSADTPQRIAELISAYDPTWIPEAP